MQETRVQSLGQEDPLEEEMATHSSILAWEIPWTEKPGGVQTVGLQRVQHDLAIKQTTTKEMLQNLGNSYYCVKKLWCHQGHHQRYSLSRVRLFVTSGTAAHQALLSMEFPRQEYWSGLPFPSPGDLPGPGIEPTSLASPALAGRFFTTEPPGKP